MNNGTRLSLQRATVILAAVLGLYLKASQSCTELLGIVARNSESPQSLRQAAVSKSGANHLHISPRRLWILNHSNLEKLKSSSVAPFKPYSIGAYESVIVTPII